MSINLFRTLNAVLTKGLEHICRATHLSQEDAASKCRIYMAENSAQYYSENPCIEYSDPFCRWAYLYTYVGAHANLIDNALTYIPELNQFVVERMRSSGQINICSLGGGPGSELLGFVKFIDRNRNLKDQIDIQFLLIDRISHWDDSWHSMVSGLEETFKEQYGPVRREWPVQVNRSFLPLDLLKVDDFRGFIARFGDTDIFILNHVVSELLAYPCELQMVLNVIAERAQLGSYFLFIDRNQQKVVDLTNQLIQECPNLYFQQHVPHKCNMDGDEQKTDLGLWYTTIGRDPKLKWNAFFTLAWKSPF